jgi:hypothetical protein
MRLSDRIRRWWAAAKWRDDHPEVSAGEGYALSEVETRTARDVRAGMDSSSSPEQQAQAELPHLFHDP